MNKSEQFGHSFTQKDIKMQNKGEYYIQKYIQIYPKNETGVLVIVL